MKEKESVAFARLLTIMDDLREKCPWDKKQTIESLRYLSIEELYELSDAILEKDHDSIKKELGDLLLHIVFYAKIENELGNFDITEVLNSICEKLIHRHPHIYGDVIAETEEQVKKNWESLKLKEGNTSVLGGVPKSLPAMVKAIRMQEKARGVGFDWDDKEQVWEKLQEEIGELKHEIDSNAPHSKIEDEFGDILFALINYSRFIGVNPEDALEKTNRKFLRRFTFMEEKISEEGLVINELNLSQLDVYWNMAKKLENKDL